MNISGLLLRLSGWRVKVSVPDYPRLLICVAPHTSNWDFILCELAIRSIGGVAVPRRNPGSASLTDFLINKFRSSERLTIAITPEGTRSRTAKWHTGFLRIAMEANVPLALAALDFRTKEISMERTFTPTGDIDADMRSIKDYYARFTGKYPEKFTTDD